MRNRKKKCVAASEQLNAARTQLFTRLMSSAETRELWKEAYLAAISAGRIRVIALYEADTAVAEYTERFYSGPEAAEKAVAETAKKAGER